MERSLVARRLLRASVRDHQRLEARCSGTYIHIDTFIHCINAQVELIVSRSTALPGSTDFLETRKQPTVVPVVPGGECLELESEQLHAILQQ